MLEPVSRVDDSNYDRLGNKLVGESRASRMARVRRQSNNPSPSLRPLGIVPNPLLEYLQSEGVPVTPGEALDMAAIKNPYGWKIAPTAYGVMSGVATGAIVGVIGNGMGWKPQDSAGVAILAGSGVAMSAPHAYGIGTMREMPLVGRILTLVGVGTVAGLVMGAIGKEFMNTAIMPKELFTKSAFGKTLLGVGGLFSLGIVTWKAEKGTWLNSVFTAAPLGVAAGVMAGFAHGAVRGSEVSQEAKDRLMLPVADRISGIRG